ncbi:uncharacterized protein PG998_002582 [Apiospora kogelbergensis]|uniref:uncharacterized protein n=1 Tax=Apiospora kogelbergensis TaxID=1337665 RepID=UPI00312EF2A8
MLDNPLLLVDASPIPRTPGLGRILDPNWVDTDLLKEWMCECLTEHQHLCENPLKLAETSPAWLIDVTNNCIIAGDGVQNYGYVALSYRWGNTACLQSELSILGELQEPGALLKPQFADRVSPTLKHAIGLARIMGERYLWADALCIVQDNGEQTRAQLQLMGAIYSSAKLTIVSIDGDADHGIPGLKGTSDPRELSVLKFPLGKSNQVVIRRVPRLFHDNGCSPYFARAWTFQEYLLSKRRLIIGNNQFHWSCSSTTCHEDMYGVDYVSHNNTRMKRFPQMLLGKPDFDELIELTMEYNERNLSFPEDALAGISGLLSIISRSFEGGFIYGLAETCFDSALMWSAANALPLQRRIHSGKDHAILQGSQLPSWSWLGWKGPIFAHTEYGEELDGPLNLFITECITQWYSQETPTSSIKHTIHSTFLDHDGKFMEGLLAKGWVKEQFDKSKHIRPDYERKPFYVLGDYVYKHPSLPERLFWRPFATQDISEDSKSKIPPQHPFISCDTKRGWFNAEKLSEPESVWDTFTAQVSVVGKTHGCCGYLQLPSDEHMAAFQATHLDNNRTVELVAICLQKMVKQERGYHGIVWNPQYDESYGVLWIEWLNGIAYRRGVGYVEKTSWENHDLEDIHLILG